ncbi:collagen alpha-4(VI) chain [Octopus bimaculoides]|uniref:VWFA domain-containing protein n=1 Tax=Octopus bimaculoides TaxID=37653 RepID=A0A0L8HWV4_OCTBM|nr:collagen alpha-4(VI) chain [Octopus bimaculoides]|eukprot:XP_014768748.1 PREDICTED: collagen alpha-4(VI) chain-like [Octopus bimaculoides]
MDVSEEPACSNKKVDILFLLDSSSSIRDVNLKKQVNVVRLMIRRFDVGPDKTRVGVSIYSHEYLPIFKIGELKTSAEVLYNMKNVIYIGGGTKTGKALEKVRTQSFNIDKKRPGVGKILVVFTDGQSSDYEKTREEAYLLKKSGVKIFVVSIGPNIDPVEIRDIASEPSKEFIHNAATFDAVMQSTEILTRKTCAAPMQSTPKDQTLCNATQPTDVIFMISRNRFGQWKTNKILQVASELIKRLGAGGPFQIGVTFDECPADQDISVGSIDDTNELIERMMSVKSRPLSSMFRRIHEDIFSSGGSYSSTGGDARKVAFVFIDSSVELDERDLSDEIKKVLLDGISIYAVAIGEDIHMPLLYRHVAKGENVITVNSYDTLKDSLPSRFISRICTRAASSGFFSL